jgi:hypothetical protein
MDEIRPIQRGVFVPDLIGQIVSRYRFAKPPTKLPEGNEPIKFEIGTIELDGLKTAIASLEIYHDGVIVNTRHTDDSDAVLNDFFTWAIREFGFREPTTLIPRRYVSQVIVEFDTSIDTIIASFEKIQRVYADAFEGASGESREFHVVQFGVAADPMNIFESFFRIEARQNVPFSQRRFFCSAPISTTAHLETLSVLERVVASA